MPIVRTAFERTIRLVATARLRAPVLLSLVEKEEDLESLAEIEGATSGRLSGVERGVEGLAANEFVHGVSHAAFINASFAYANPRRLNRFNGPGRGAWYSAISVETCLAEVAFHMTNFLADAGRLEATVDYAEMHASLAGEFVDLRSVSGHPSLSPDVSVGYPAGNAVAAEAFALGLSGIIYPSVRHAGGICVAALRPHAVQSVAQGDIWRLQWSGDVTPTMVKTEKAGPQN